MFQTQFAYLEEMHRKEGELKTEERGSYNERAKVSFVSHHARIARTVFIQRGSEIIHQNKKLEMGLQFGIVFYKNTALMVLLMFISRNNKKRYSVILANSRMH